MIDPYGFAPLFIHASLLSKFHGHNFDIKSRDATLQRLMIIVTRSRAGVAFAPAS